MTRVLYAELDGHSHLLRHQAELDHPLFVVRRVLAVNRDKIIRPSLNQCLEPITVDGDRGAHPYDGVPLVDALLQICHLLPFGVDSDPSTVGGRAPATVHHILTRRR